LRQGSAVDEPEIWRLARAGDPAAFAEIYDLHRDKVYAQAYRWTQSRHDAEDVLAMAFFEAWRSRSKVRVVNESIAAWLLVTTTHLAQNVTRSARRHRMALSKLPLREAADDHAISVLEAIAQNETDARVRDAFAKLKTRDQDVLTLCVINEFSLGHASEALGVPVGTIKSRLSRAKTRLAALTGPLTSEDSVPPLFGGTP
jgi:RNA polymerase sigma factor (sigma-70 family)